MGTRLRVFFVDDDESLRRISMARYQRLINRDPFGSFSEYAGKRVRCATVFLEVADRKPLAILGINYSIVHFDATGQIDAAKDEREMRLAMELMPPLFEEQRPAQIINAKERFIKKQYEHEFKWVPTPQLERAIIETVFPEDSW